MTPHSKDPADGSAQSAFGALDECHRQTLAALDKLEIVVARLDAGAVDGETRALAGDVVRHFSTTARQHHLDEERHVFPKLAASGDPAIEQTVMRLRQDHYWLEEDWMTLLPHLDAIACGQSWYDAALLREGSEVFAALARDHIALEETCLYPEARARLRPDEQQQMGREMAARRRATRSSGQDPAARP
jgi:hemerythrin-like domain-containing protein